MTLSPNIVNETIANAKTVEKAKAYRDFYWERLVQSNELNSLYVSKLDLYLIKNLNISRKKNAKRKVSQKQTKLRQLSSIFTQIVGKRS